MKRLLIMTAIAIGVASCETNETMKTKLTENLDTTYKAGEDFFQYATGGWQKANPITDEYARYGQFDALREKNREQLKDLVLEQAAKESEPQQCTEGGRPLQTCYGQHTPQQRRHRAGETIH